MSRTGYVGRGRRPWDLLVGLAHGIHRGVIAPVNRPLQRRAREAAMMQLDEHLLRDIGLSRAQVHAAAFGWLTLPQSTQQDSRSQSPTPAWAQDLRRGRSAVEPRVVWNADRAA